MTNKERQERTYANFTMIRALEEVDLEKAIAVVSDPDLNGEELSEIMEASMMGRIINKKTGEPSKLHIKVMQAAMINKVDQISRKFKNESE